eukprot:Skav221431  [mRNA]  locus=scaffold4701:53936:64847:- [translate_table: standard]
MLTVQPKTRERYNRALERFFRYLRERDLQLPRQKSLLDPLISDYIEWLWSQGEGRSLASDSIAALQDRDPSIKGHLSSCWRLLKTWASHEILNRAPPLTEEAVQTLAGYALFHDRSAFALSLLVGFYGLLRTGELLGLRNQDIVQSGPTSVAVISLGLTKAGQRVGASESVTISEEDTLRRLWQWKQSQSKGASLCPSPSGNLLHGVTTVVCYVGLLADLTTTTVPPNATTTTTTHWLSAEDMQKYPKFVRQWLAEHPGMSLKDMPGYESILNMSQKVEGVPVSIGALPFRRNLSSAYASAAAAYYGAGGSNYDGSLGAGSCCGPGRGLVLESDGSFNLSTRGFLRCAEKGCKTNVLLDFNRTLVSINQSWRCRPAAKRCADR